MKIIALYVVAFAILLVPSAANAEPNPGLKSYSKKEKTEKSTAQQQLKLPDVAALTKALWKADRKILPKQKWKSATVLAFLKERQWLMAPNKEKCWEVPWQRTCTAARASYRLHSALAAVATRRLLYELPLTNDWLTALKIAQRPYPGTYDDGYRISDKEGGFGPWVWYSGACSNSPCLWQGYHVGGDNVSGADTVGGWVQFRWSTFAPYWRQTKADLRRRGFIIPLMEMPPEGGPSIYAPWLSPLGQALTVSYMHYYGKQGCHWC